MNELTTREPINANERTYVKELIGLRMKVLAEIGLDHYTYLQCRELTDARVVMLIFHHGGEKADYLISKFIKDVERLEATYITP